MTARSYLLTDWVTIRGNTSTVPGATQDGSQWLDLSAFADATFWIEVAEVTAPGSGTVVLNLESAPFLDDATFALAAPPVTLSASATPYVVKSIAAVSAAGLARFVRWRISTTGSGAWDVTMRVRVVGNRSTYFRPTQVSGCCLWLRSDLGIGLSGTNITSWADQSGLGSNATQGTSTPVYNITGGVNALPRVTVTAGQYMTGAFSPSVTNHTAFAVLGYPALSNVAAFAATTDATFVVNSGFAQFTETPTGIIGRTASNVGGVASAITTDTTSLGSVGIYSTAASSSGNVDLWVNGVSKASAAASFTLASCADYILFSLGGAPLQYKFAGDAYEFIIFNSVLSASDRLRVHRYLGARYGINVP